MRNRAGAILAFGLLMRLAAPGRSPTAPGRRRSCSIGDSIRLGYAPGVAARLAGKAAVVSPPANGGDSANVLAHLDEWVIREKPDVVHLNCGLHDLKLARADGRHQVELDRYAANLRQIVARIRAGTDAALVFANTTPIVDERHAPARRGLRPDRGRRAAVQRRGRLGHARGRRAGPRPALGRRAGRAGDDARPDGTHYTPAGSDRLAEAVADCVAPGT